MERLRLTARLSPPGVRYPDGTSLRAFADRLLEGGRALPGVQEAGITSNISFGGDWRGWDTWESA